MNWELTINFYWPHHRFMMGWEFLYSDEKYPYDTIKLHLLFLSLTLDIE